MFELEGFDPWTGVGDKYATSMPRIMVVGDSRLDAPLTDRECILRKLAASHDLIFTNFDQAVLGLRHWHVGYRGEVRAFWERTLFYNYNVLFLPERGRASLSQQMRRDPLNAKILRQMLRAFAPTHVIVWGRDNWQAMAIEGQAWERDETLRCGERGEPFRIAVLDGLKTLFTCVAHPSAGFAYDRWSPLLSQFLSLPA
ncbi:MAG TPA: hypothetical protein VET85_10030 [Stellaceae bacterium]|nr:hypothetical protein [Stellaceae bacterium]